MNIKTQNFKQNLSNTFKNSIFMLNFVWKESEGKTYILLKTIESLFNSIFPLFYVLFPGWLINELSGNRNYSIIIIYVCCITVLPFLVQLLNSFLGVKLYKLEFEI